jgi:hypothetical protein
MTHVTCGMYIALIVAGWMEKGTMLIGSTVRACVRACIIATRHVGRSVLQIHIVSRHNVC